MATAAQAGPTILSDAQMDSVVAGAGEIGDLFSGADPGTVGTTISGVIYGNTSNQRPSGHGVLPSLAPGPWVCGDTSNCAGPTDPGGSMGDFLAPIASGGKASPEFAHGNDLNLNFSH
jgi:hypothetical protein